MQKIKWFCFEFWHVAHTWYVVSDLAIWEILGDPVLALYLPDTWYQYWCVPTWHLRLGLLSLSCSVLLSSPLFNAGDKAHMTPICLASALQFHCPWQMLEIRTMWSLTIWPPCQVGTEVVHGKLSDMLSVCCPAMSQGKWGGQDGRLAVPPYHPIAIYLAHVQDSLTPQTDRQTGLTELDQLVPFVYLAMCPLPPWDLSSSAHFQTLKQNRVLARLTVVRRKYAHPFSTGTRLFLCTDIIILGITYLFEHLYNIGLALFFKFCIYSQRIRQWVSPHTYSIHTTVLTASMLWHLYLLLHGELKST